MKTFEEKLVDAVRERREAEGLSLRALSAAVGVSFSTLARIERGDGLPDNNSKIRLLEWLGTDGEAAGLHFDSVAHVHFRATKNIGSATVRSLLQAANWLRQRYALPEGQAVLPRQDEDSFKTSLPLSKEEREQAAEDFRQEVGLGNEDPLDSLKLSIDGVLVCPASKTDCLPASILDHLTSAAVTEWSAMSVPLDATHERWSILLNDGHSIERQRVTLLEEFWHILLGHKLTKIARISDAYGRTYDKAEEDDAFYIAAATLLPRQPILQGVKDGRTSADLAAQFGTSPELVEYRVKRLGVWRDYVGKRVSLSRT